MGVIPLYLHSDKKQIPTISKTDVRSLEKAEGGTVETLAANTSPTWAQLKSSSIQFQLLSAKARCEQCWTKRWIAHCKWHTGEKTCLNYISVIMNLWFVFKLHLGFKEGFNSSPLPCCLLHNFPCWNWTSCSTYGMLPGKKGHPSTPAPLSIATQGNSRHWKPHSINIHYYY